jgi:DNA topoisomerase-1
MATLSLPSKIKLPRQKLQQLSNGDPAATARAVRLVYVSDMQEGIVRVRSGRGFRYLFRNKYIREKIHLQRIRGLVLPPAWKDVWICILENGHLQATGKDSRQRKQYRYHPLWNELRNHTKFFRMMDFGTVLPRIRQRVKKDLARKGLPKEKVLAAMIALMERTNIRVGHELYEKLYGSVGMTTLRDKHVHVKGESLKFTFKGKKGKEHFITIRNRKLAQLVRHCREIPGKELFQYYDAEGQRQSVDSGMVNDYIREISGGDFTAKDFRTWSGTVQCFMALREYGPAKDLKEARSNMIGALDKVAASLGNTRSVCKKYYVHPCLADLYENRKLDPWLVKNAARQSAGPTTALSNEEKWVLQILKKSS